MDDSREASFSSQQEQFWYGEFGHDYITRNDGEVVVASNIKLFHRIFEKTPSVRTICELGCNIGLNIEALKMINHEYAITGYEINREAVKIADRKKLATIVNATIVNDLRDGRQYDITFTKGVLIHINPALLQNVYANLYNLSTKYILICEYYNPTPVSINYRGHADRLFKRDFAGELIELYDLTLLDYGFVYHRDRRAPQDDLTWFLLEK